MGNKAFLINQAKIWEIYFYENEIFMYARLLLEESLDKNNFKKWISLDIDTVIDSAWFEEKSIKIGD